MMPIVVNRHHFMYVDGVGPPPKKKPRKGKNYLPAPWIYVGRKVSGHPGGSPLANQYRPRSASFDGEAVTHDAALALYRRWLWQKIRGNDYSVLLAMRSITDDSALVCSCAPKACHADIVLRAWQWVRARGML
jgi:hypothetical protein